MERNEIRKCGNLFFFYHYKLNKIFSPNTLCFFVRKKFFHVSAMTSNSWYPTKSKKERRGLHLARIHLRMENVFPTTSAEFFVRVPRYREVCPSVIRLFLHLAALNVNITLDYESLSFTNIKKKKKGRREIMRISR